MAPTYLLPVGPTHFSPLPLPKSSPPRGRLQAVPCLRCTNCNTEWLAYYLQHTPKACIVIPTHRMRQVNLLANDAEKLLFAMFSFNLGWTAPVMIVFSLFGLVREARMASAMSRYGNPWRCARGMLCTWHDKVPAVTRSRPSPSSALA